MVNSHSAILWQFLVTELVKDCMCSSVLNTIRINNNSFFKNADQKSYILPLLTCISKEMETQKCSELLDQIVEINGERALEKVVKESKISSPHVDSYLKKWKIHVGGNSSQPSVEKGKNAIMGPFSPAAILHSKLERLSSEAESPWPLTPSPAHILRMISQMIAMGEPFQTLATPTFLKESEVALVSNLKPDLIEDYSDLLCKWIYWRMHIEFQPANLECIFGLFLKLITSGFELHEDELNTLLAALVGCLSIHKSLYLKPVADLSLHLNERLSYKEKAFRFWINSFNDSSAPVDEILKLIVTAYHDMIPSEMVTLARYPAVVRNKDFSSYLRGSYTEKLLTVYGFKLQDFGQDQPKQTIS
jgi:hypothetical protein